MKKSNQITTMSWNDRSWLCECGAKYEWYTTWCATGCGKQNITDGKGSLIQRV